MWFLFFTPIASGQMVINEIMYDLEGSDSGYEWIEVYNNGAESVDLTGWKFNDGSNHNLDISSEKGGQGSFVVTPAEYIILTGGALLFLSEHSGYSGTVIDTVMSLNNTSEILSLIDVDSNEVDSVTYTNELGANGDGESLQLINGVFKASSPTLGSVNILSTSSESPTPNEEVDNDESVEENISGGMTYPTKQQIFADAGGDKTVIVGADTIFTGTAHGLKGEVLKNARYVWNFGDGVLREGKSILHTYQYPNTYTVTLSVSSLEYSAIDRITVDAHKAEVAIGVANDEYIEVINNSDYELDVSLWSLVSGEQTFRLPKNTIILPHHKNIFPKTITMLSVSNPYDVSIKYPNGVAAVTFGDESVLFKSVAVAPQVKPIEQKIVYVPQVIVEEEEKDVLPKGSNVDEEMLVASALIPKPGQSSGDLYKWLIALVSIISVAILLFLSREKIRELNSVIDGATGEMVSSNEFVIIEEDEKQKGGL